MRNLVFVYGTLRRGGYNNYLLTENRARFIGTGTVEGALLSFGSFPGFVKAQGSRVVGDVYIVNGKTVEQLDRLERVGVWYDRVRCTVTMDGQMAVAEVYVATEAMAGRGTPSQPVDGVYDWLRGEGGA